MRAAFRPGPGRRQGRLSRNTLRFSHARTAHKHVQELMRFFNRLMRRSVAPRLLNDCLKRIHCLRLSR